MANPDHPRLILHDFLSPDLCKELGFIHRSCATVGYRSNVFSTTLSHLIATDCAHLIMPFVPIRERLKEKAEEFFGCEYELFVEFTGLIRYLAGGCSGQLKVQGVLILVRNVSYELWKSHNSWNKGASIGWHSDDNRPYLKQRDFAAVCYLNSHGEDFKGGHFHFQDGEPQTITPMAGDVVMYTADSKNVHSVDEIAAGERLTLTLWFSRDESHDEDAKLISFLTQRQLQWSLQGPNSVVPLPASSKMYWFPPEDSNCESGFDICFARLHALGYDIYSLQDSFPLSSSDLSIDFSEIPMKSLRLVREDQLFDHQFSNILHALQVVQFYCWKRLELRPPEHWKEVKVIQLSQTQKEEVKKLKSIFLKDEKLAEILFRCAPSEKFEQLDWESFCGAAIAWEAYCNKHMEDLCLSLPHWRTNHSIYWVSSLGVEKAASEP